jgi:hypothetical protein
MNVPCSRKLTLLSPRIWLTPTCALLVLKLWAVVPDHTVTNGAVYLKSVGPDNPILYDNDWWFDVFDNNYLWAQASLGKVNLRGNIVSRDMWDWDKGYLYSMQKCVDDAQKALKLARDAGLRNIPDITRGSDRVLTRPESGRIQDTKSHPSDGSRLIVAEAKKASPEKPLLVIAGGPLTTVANALLTNPEIASNLVVFNLTVTSYGYNGKDGWSAYLVARRTRYVDWGGGQFWEKDSVFTTKDFEALPDNPFTLDMKRFIKTDLGRANQLGDGAPLVWLFQPRCWTDAEEYRASFQGKALTFTRAQPGDVGDALVIPKAATDLQASREEFFRVLTNPAVYQPGTAAKVTVAQGLTVTALGKRYTPHPVHVLVQQTQADMGGNTLVRNAGPLTWKESGYFQRARDLGQVFRAPRDFTLAALVLRTGNDRLGFLPGAADAEVFVQFFEVTGDPVINDNGTPPGTMATHGFSSNHRCDDFVTHVRYQPLVVLTGGRFPDLATSGDGKLTYLKWSFAPHDALRFHAGRRYAFMVGFIEPGPDRSFALANRNNANSPRPPHIADPLDAYPVGWGLRREGNGTSPPAMVPSARPPLDPVQLGQLELESTFPPGDARFALPPTCDGYPDVDTYRDLEFYLEAADCSQGGWCL